MKTYAYKLLTLFWIASLIFSCVPKEEKKEEKEHSESHFPYSLEVKELTDKTNAPSLQSFAHGVHQDYWLLFAGRTNSADSLNGGLHKIDGNSNYADTSFTPPSFNENIFVYNMTNDTVEQISLSDLKNLLKTKFPNNYKALEGFDNIFKNSNALVKQQGEYVYVIGGYGPINFAKPKDGYITYNQVAKIHIPSLISLVKGDYDSVDAEHLFAFGRHDSLISTGGELHTMGSGSSATFYLAGGHNFGNNQKYVDAVYPFTLKDSSHVLTINVSTPITDVLDPTEPLADNLSILRRRDGPIVPSIYRSPVKGKIEQGLAFYTGVFKPGQDLQAWNDAVYIHPKFANAEGKLFTQDKSYNQNNYNVYSCPNFVVYDSKTDVSHTFLMGGIGDGSYAESGNLSGFTNTAVHIETRIGESPLRSTHQLIKSNHLFNHSEENKPPFYGAEAILFVNDDIPLFAIADETSSTTTDILDMSTFEDSDIEVGYIFGGIEAFRSNPGTYGKTYSRASNKIWKVVLKKK